MRRHRSRLASGLFGLTLALLASVTLVSAREKHLAPPNPRIGFAVGSTVRATVAPGTKLALPIAIDMSNAGGRNVAALTAALSWPTARVTFDSIRTAGFGALTSNITNASSGSISFSVFSADGTGTNTTVATLYLTATNAVGGGSVTVTPSVAGDDVGAEIQSLFRVRGFDVCVGTPGKWGDVNGDPTTSPQGDGLVNIIDAQQIARFSVSLGVANAAGLAARGDVTANGSVDIIDAQQIARFSVGLSTAARVSTDVFSPPAVGSVVAAPATASLDVGASVQLGATPEDASSASVAGCAPVTWTTSSAAVATVDSTGLVTAIARGNATITAASGGRTATAAVTVAGGSIAPITVTSVTPAAGASNVNVEGTVQVVFSGPINAATVTASTVTLSQGATPVAGTLAVSGNTVTFTPAAPLKDVLSSHTVKITTDVKATDGGSLAADFTASFTTQLANPAYSYRLTNEAAGTTKAFGVTANAVTCLFSDVADASTQYWKISPAGSYYTLNNLAAASNKGLEAGAIGSACAMTNTPAAGGFFTGQLWKISPYGEAYPTAVRLESYTTTNSLDAPFISAVRVPSLGATANTTGQVWYLTRLGRIPLLVSSVTPATGAAGVAPTSTIVMTFSMPIDVSTVTATTFSVLKGTTPVAGTLSASGSTVTFTPTALLDESAAQYSVVVGTGLKGTNGSVLAAPYTTTFRTILVDPGYYYRLTNEFVGGTKSLEATLANIECVFADNGGSAGQQWYFVPVEGNVDRYALKNAALGDTKGLEGGATGFACLMTGFPSAGGLFGGQIWHVSANADVFPGGIRIESDGPGSSLDAPLLDNVRRPGIQATGSGSGQVWYLTRLGARAPEVSSVVITPPSATLTSVGATQQLTFVARDAGNTIIPGVTYTLVSSASSVATVNANGLVTAVANGTATISAVTANGKIGTTVITVAIPVPVASVVVTFPAPAVVGVTATPTVETRAPDASVLTGRAITYTSATTSVATINATTGVITPVAPGSTLITASSEGVSGSATLTVLPTAEANRFAFVYGDNQSAALNTAYAPNANYSTNGSGGTMSVTRTGVGAYSVLLNKLAKTNNAVREAVFVQTEGETPVVCRLSTWVNTTPTDVTVSVRCANLSGVATDAVFDILFVGSRSLAGAMAFYWNPDGTTSNTGSSLYYYSSTAISPTVTRLGAGQYQFDMGTGAIGRSTALVSGYQGTRSCPLQSWNTTTSSLLVNCYAPLSTTLTDNQATVLLLSQGRAGKRWGFLQIENGSTALNVVQSPNVATQNQSNGGLTTYTRIGTGRYKVRFAGLAASFKEMMLVTGMASSHCQLITFVNEGADIVGDVQCFSVATGAAADTPLAVLFIE